MRSDPPVRSRKSTRKYAVILATGDGRQEIWDTTTARDVYADLRDGAIEGQPRAKR